MYLIGISLKKLYDIAGYMSFTYLGLDLIFGFIKSPPTLLENVDGWVSLLIKIVAVIVAIFKGYDYYYETSFRRKLQIEDLQSKKYDNLIKQHKIEIYDKDNNVNSFISKIRAGLINDLELNDLGLDSEEIKQIKNS